jgi:transcriptional regulatory protein LevR
MSNTSQVFQQRFELLLKSGLASEASIAAARQALRTVEEHYGMQLSETLGAPLVTHLAVTGNRLLRGEQLQPAGDLVWQELQAYPAELDLAALVVAGLEKQLAIQIARDEVGFLALHLAKISLEISNATPQEHS